MMSSTLFQLNAYGKDNVVCSSKTILKQNNIATKINTAESDR